MSESKKVKYITEKNIGDHPLKLIWNFYDREDTLDNSEHYEAICKACDKKFSPEKLSQMEKHIISECKKVSETVKEAVIYIIKSCDNLSNISGTKHSNEQLCLDKFLE
ncbi:2540_t:CDS:1, partial [Racocetra fulgida]